MKFGLSDKRLSDEGLSDKGFSSQPGFFSQRNLRERLVILKYFIS